LSSTVVTALVRASVISPSVRGMGGYLVELADDGIAQGGKTGSELPDDERGQAARNADNAELADSDGCPLGPPVSLQPRREGHQEGG
jgi:hypothetical protein